MRQNPLKKIVELQKQGKNVGIYSVCSANGYVIEAAFKRGLSDGSCVLIESTANQCDQNGGYTGMTPADFKKFVLEIADRNGFDRNRIFLGGDHLGPLTFAYKDEAEAMADSEELIRHYVAAGFTKIHIDTSMKVNSDRKTFVCPTRSLQDAALILQKLRKRHIKSCWSVIRKQFRRYM